MPRQEPSRPSTSSNNNITGAGGGAINIPVARHTDDVSQFVSQVTTMLQQKLTQHENDIQQVMQEKTIQEERHQQSGNLDALLDPACPQQQQQTGAPPLVAIPTTNPSPSAAAGAAAASVAGTSKKKTKKDLVISAPPTDKAPRGVVTTTTVSEPSNDMAANVKAKASPLGNPITTTASSYADIVDAPVSAPSTNSNDNGQRIFESNGGSSMGTTTAHPTAKNVVPHPSPPVKPRAVSYASSASRVRVPSTFNNNNSSAASTGELDMADMPLFHAAAGDSLVTVIAAGSPGASTSSVSYTGGGGALGAAPAIRIPPALHGKVFASGAELLQALNDAGVPMEFLQTTPPQSFDLDAKEGMPGVGNGGVAPVAQLKLSAAEKWKQRVAMILGPVQLGGTKDTLFSVRTEIDSLHKRHPVETKHLQTAVTSTKKDLVAVYQLLTNKQYLKDTEELKEKIGSTDTQIASEVKEHSNVVTLFESAIHMMQSAVNSSPSINDVVIPGVDDIEKLSIEELDKHLERTTDPVAKKSLAVRSFLLKCKTKAEEQKVVSAKAVEASAIKREDPREHLMSKMKHIASTAGLNLDAEVRALPPAALDPNSIAELEEDLLGDATDEHHGGGGDAAAGVGAKPSSLDLSALARQMSSFRRAHADTSPSSSSSPKTGPGGIGGAAANRNGKPVNIARGSVDDGSPESAQLNGSLNRSFSSAISPSNTAAKRNDSIRRSTRFGMEPVVYTSAQRQEDANKLGAYATTLRKQAVSALSAAEADYAARLKEEAEIKQQWEGRTMEQMLKDTIDGRTAPVVNRITAQDLERIRTEVSEAHRVASDMEALQAEELAAVHLREDLLGKAKYPLIAELKEVEERVMRNTSALHQAHQNRKNLLRQYWNWRQRTELGDAKAARTFEEEVQRGPQIRHVGVQNVIQTEYLSQQVLWLRQLLQREDVFRRHIEKVEAMVHDLDEVNGLIHRAIRCPACTRIMRDPVSMWPCGHSFCASCCEGLAVSQHLQRCSVCLSMGSEGFLPNVLLSEIIAKVAVKESGYADIQGSLHSVKEQLQMFQRDRLELRIAALEYRRRQVQEQQYFSGGGGGGGSRVSVSRYPVRMSTTK